jgi:hypothetical protein
MTCLLELLKSILAKFTNKKPNNTIKPNNNDDHTFDKAIDKQIEESLERNKENLDNLNKEIDSDGDVADNLVVIPDNPEDVVEIIIEEKDKMIDLVPDRKDYYRQTNNELEPGVSCFATSVTAGIDVVDAHDVSRLEQLFTYKQPEDNLRWFILHDKECLKFCDKSHPGTDVNPAEWADVMVFAVNKIYMKEKVFYDANITLDELDYDLAHGKPAIMSFRFPERMITGHYVLVCGKSEENYIINDPYKNFLKNTPDGYHCLYNLREFFDHAKGYGLRFC